MNCFQRALPMVTALSLLIILNARSSDAAPDAASQRRIIVNDDGEVLLPTNQESWDEYLAERFSPVVHTQVDSYFLCVGSTDRGPGIVHSLQSSMSYWAAYKKLPPQYIEATQRHLDAARNNGIEIFASIRMNDVHDANLPSASHLTYPLKITHPELMLGNEAALQMGREAYPEGAVMRRFWCGFDWAREEVRQHFLDFITSYCAQFDFDGLELDYFRHPLMFKIGEESDHIEAMTEFVANVRKALNEIGEKRGRPYLLTVRVPDSPVLAKRTGLDVEAWLKEKQLDLLVVGGGFMPYSGRLKEFVDLAHSYNVPAYPCLDLLRGTGLAYSAASNFFALGGDGTYLFNYFGVVTDDNKTRRLARMALRELGDPQTLRWVNKSYEPDPGSSSDYFGFNVGSGPFPVGLLDNRPVELVVGDDIAEGSRTRKLRTTRLHITASDVEDDALIGIFVNNTGIAADSIERVNETSFTADLPPEVLRQGINQLVFAHGANSNGSPTSKVTGAQLRLEYSPQYEFEDITISPASAHEPLRRDFSTAHAADYIDKGATAWTKKRDCLACHTNASYAVIRPALTPHIGKPDDLHREFLVKTLKKYQAMELKRLRDGIRPTQVAYAAQGLAEWDAHVTGSLSAETRAALKLMFDVQGEAGDWANTTCWPPLESHPYQSTTVAALALATAPTYLETLTDEALKGGVEKMKNYLRSTPPPHDYGGLLLLWVATRMPDVLASQAQRAELIDVIWKHQREDGGWSIRSFSTPEDWGSGNRAEKLRAEPEFENPPSDGHQTGLCVMVLRDAGVPAEDPRLQKAVKWLLANQRESGRWWTRSLNTDNFNFITFSGTCYPLLALAKCGALPPLSDGPGN